MLGSREVYAALGVAACAGLLVGGSARAQIAGENVNIVSGTQWPGGDPFLQRQNEPTVAVSSVNPQHLLAVTNDYRSVDIADPVYGVPIVGDAWHGVFKSLDGGQTWRSVPLPGYPQECRAVAAENARRVAADPAARLLPVSPLCDNPAAADPVVRAGTEGLFYLGGINFQRDKSRSRIFVARFLDENNKENGTPLGPDFDPSRPTLFTSSDPIRYVDAVEVWSSARNAQAYPSAPRMFLDKPWLAVDVPRAAVSCNLRTASGASILAGMVYVAWTQFYPDDYQSDVMLSWSANCGESWSTPVKLNTANSVANQGVSVAIEPLTGRVYVAWRRAAWPPTNPRQGDAIMMTRSEGRRKNFAAPRVVAPLVPFDQANGPGRARTQTMPSLALSTDGANSWVHVAWAARVAAGGDARIFTSSAKVHPRPAGDDDVDDPEEYDAETRIRWSAPALADGAPLADDAGNTFTRGHQYMPSLTFGQGRLMLLYYDTRLDHTVRTYRALPGPWADGKFYREVLAPKGDLLDPNGLATVFTPEVDDYAVPVASRPHAWRHTIDVRLVSLPWGNTAGGEAIQVSRYPLGIRGDEANPDGQDPAPVPPITLPGFANGAIVPGALTLVDANHTLLLEQQLQLNVPGYKMFKGSSSAFLGDYVDIQGPMFRPTGNGWWAFNWAPSRTPVFHAVWTSNQDVKVPADGDWSRYTPVTALLGAFGPVLYDGGRQIDEGRGTVTPVLVCDPGSVGSRDQNVYTSRITEGLQVTSPQNVKPLAADAPVSFVVSALNATPAAMAVVLSASSASPVTVPAPASAVVDYSFTPAFSAPVTSVCANIPPYSAVTRTLFAQLKTFALANPPLYVQVDEVASCEPGAARLGRSGSLTLNPPVAFNSLVQPDGASLPPLGQGEVYAVVTAAPTLTNPGASPTLTNPTLTNDSLANPTLTNPTLTNPTLTNPTLTNPTLTNPTLTNPTLTNPTLTNPTLTNPTLTNPTLTNTAPWDWSQTVTNTGNTTTSLHVKLVGEGVDPGLPLQLILSKTYFTPAAVGCELRQVPHDQLVVSVPGIQRAIVPASTVVDPGASDPTLTNATVALAPGESATITLRGFVRTVQEMAAVVSQVQAVAVPAAVTPQPGVTYETYTPPAGQPPLLKAASLTSLSLVGGTFTATVGQDPAWGAPPPAPPSGDVVFIVNGATVAHTAALAGGAASFTPAPALTSADTVTALYLGDVWWAASTSLAVRGTAVGTHTTLDSLPVIWSAGAPVTLRALVTVDDPLITDLSVLRLAWVEFTLDGATVQRQLNEGGPLLTATYTTGALSAGAHTFSARFLGFGEYQPSDSNVLSQVVAAGAMQRPNRLVAGGTQSFAILGDGRVLAWGQNNGGALGDSVPLGAVQPRPFAFPPIAGENLVTLDGRAWQSAAVTASGRAYRWGWADAIGVPPDPVLGQNVPTPQGVLTASDFVAVSTGYGHNLGLRAGGQVYGWGLETDGRIGPPLGNGEARQIAMPPMVAVAGGGGHSLALAPDGSVWAWGLNGFGQLGDGSTASRTAPAPVPGLAGIVELDAGTYHSIARSADGTVYTWGYNGNGELGQGLDPAVVTMRATPAAVALPPVAAISAGQHHSLALLLDGTVRAWGSNTYGHGALGDGTFTDRPGPVAVAGLSSVTEVHAGEFHSLARTADGNLWAWGGNNVPSAVGVLGAGPRADSNVPVRVLVGGFSATPMPVARASFLAAAAGSRVYVIGLEGPTYEIYDPAADAWTTAPLPPATGFQTGATIGPAVYLARDGDVTVHRLDTGPGGTWAAWVPLPGTSSGVSLAAVGTDLYAIVGGAGAVSYRYDTTLGLGGAWEARARIPGPARSWLATAALGGRIYALGSSATPGLARLDVYDPAADTWSAAAAPGGEATAVTLTALGGRLYAIGTGVGANRVQVYDPALDRWALSDFAMPTGRVTAAAAAWDGSLYVFGGAATVGGSPLVTTEVFVPEP